MRAAEQVEQALTEAEKINRKFNCFTTIATDARAKKTARGKLSGKVISVKDAICTKGIRTTAGSAMLVDYVPSFNATVIERIEAEGGVIIGKTAMDAFGFGTFCTNVGKGLPVPKNPHDIERATGGSSGGAGAATHAFSDSANHLALAESTGGSITAPAAFCGVVGFTPSYGRVSRYGLIDYANSLDKIGTMGKTVEEAELLARVISGKDEKDETSLSQQEKPPKNVKRVAVIKEMLNGVDAKIKKSFWDAVHKIDMAYEEVSFPLMDYSVASYYILATAEASSNLARYGGMRYGAQEKIEGSFNEHFARIRSRYFSDEEKRRIILGTFVRTAGYKDRYYMKALKIREKIKQEFGLLFRKYDALLSPSMPMVAPRFDEIKKLKPVEAYALDSCTIPPNLAGLPHLSIPIGKVGDLPIGMQVICNTWEENTLFGLGKKLGGLL